MKLETIKSINIFGVRVDRVNLDQTLDIIHKFIKKGKPHQVVVVNVAKIVMARRDAFIRTIINEADIVGADGVPIIWVSKILGAPIPGRVNGTDLMIALIDQAAKMSYRVYFLGAKEEVVQKVIKIYSNKYPDLNIAGFHNGYFQAHQEFSIAKKINQSKADILFVGFGSPKKEIFIKKYLHVMNVSVVHGVGGSFDVIAGITKRAPLWMQKSGLEWLYRFIQEPRRMWRRYLITNFKFIGLIFIHFLTVLMNSIIAKGRIKKLK